MPPVIFSVIVGTAIGLALHLGDWIQKGAVQMNRLIMGLFSRTGDEKADKEFTAAMITLSCYSVSVERVFMVLLLLEWSEITVFCLQNLFWIFLQR